VNEKFAIAEYAPRKCNQLRHLVPLQNRPGAREPEPRAQKPSMKELPSPYGTVRINPPLVPDAKLTPLG
jgi:hypothetical protein